MDVGETLAFSWSWDHDDLPARDVVIDFAPSAAGTTVTVTHTADTDEEAAGYAEGWAHFLAALAARLDGG